MARRPQDHDGGFSLMELLVVVAIIAIIAAVAIPVFMHQKARAYEAEVKSHVAAVAKLAETALADGATSLRRDGSVITDGADLRISVQNRAAVGWNIAGSEGAYCITGWSADGGKYRSEVPLVYDSTAGGIVSGADCTAVAGVQAGFLTGGYTPPAPPAPNQITFVYDLTVPTCTTQTLTLPLEQLTGTIDWGDGTVEPLASWARPTHTYTTQRSYNVTLTGTIRAFNGSQPTTRPTAGCLVSVPTWGPATGTVTMNHAFAYATALTYVAPPPTTVTNMSRVFNNSTFNGDLTGWDTRNVTTMEGMFAGNSVFNRPLAHLDVSSVTSMASMFYQARSFNQPLANWNVGNVQNMSRMFEGPMTSFNQPLAAWNTANANNMSRMFYAATAMTHDLSGWDVAMVADRTDFNWSSPVRVPIWAP